MSPTRVIMAIFLLQPIAFGSWLPRIPDVQQALGLGPATLALALLGLPVGTLLALPFAGPAGGADRGEKPYLNRASPGLPCV